VFNRLNEVVSIILLAAALIAAAGYVTVKYFKPDICEDDGLIEEFVLEPAVEKTLGLESGSVDLTPNSPEK